MRIIFILTVCLFGNIFAFNHSSQEMNKTRSKRDLIYWNRASNGVLKYAYKRQLRAIENKDEASDIMDQIRRHLKNFQKQKQK